MRRAPLAALLAALAVAVLAPASAGAHPLGNFTTNQLVTVSFDEHEARLGIVLDLAEIPTYQLIGRYDADGDGAIAGAEGEPLIAELQREVEGGLTVRAAGRATPVKAAGDPELSFPPGQAGLSLTRLELPYAAALPAGAADVEVTNDAFSDRTGWRAIQVLPGEGTNVTSSVSATDPTRGLTVYPKDVLQSPADDRSASFEVSSGAGTVSAPDGISGDGFTDDRGAGGFAGLLTGGDTHGLMILLLLAAAFGWGALHALSPGHGKSMVAGYLAGSRGKPRHAVALGLTVTATHTVSVFALGLITLAASQYILPEDLYPWLGIVSGLLVVGIGLSVMRSRFRRWRAMRSPHAEGHHHHHHHDPHHGHAHDHAAPIRTRELLGLGVSGGLVPCPSALVVLVAAISQHRIGLGMVLILAFSVGLAATVTGVGLVTIWGKRLVARLNPEKKLFGGRLGGALPAISASAIVLVGLLITYRAIPTLG
jgi:ABC-type nickel/cobalt efflux system permease component RcnA